MLKIINNENVITPAALPQLSQSPPDELILPPVLVPQLQMAAEKPLTTTNTQLDSSPKLKSTNIKTELLSLEMFNHAATDLGKRGEINLKKYNKYLSKKSKPI